MEAYQQRVKDELAELSEKMGKLSMFISGDVYNSLPSDEQNDLTAQLAVMSDYATILERRITRFN